MNNHLTPKAQKLYNEAKLAFQEYEKDWVLDMLDNYYDFLLASDDDFLDLFDITYDTEIETDIFGDTSYVDPEVILTPKAPHKFEPLYIMVAGYVLPRNAFCDGFGIQCYVNEDCRELGRQCVKLMKKLLEVK